MRIVIDDNSGFCFGVVNAIGKAEESLAERGEVWSLGDIVHNNSEVRRLEELGLRKAEHGMLGTLRGKTLLIRAHGEPPSTYRLAEESGIEVIDATCPVVARLQRLVIEAHRRMSEVGGQVVILGKKGHAEVVGLTGGVDGDALVVENEDDLCMVDFLRPIYLLSQTTQSLRLWNSIKEEILRRAKDPSTVVADDTICRQVSNREGQLTRFAAEFDVVIFVSGRKSSNGKVLYEVCRAANPRCHMVEQEDELRREWFDGAASVGICGATSTPKWQMKRIAEAITALCE